MEVQELDGDRMVGQFNEALHREDLLFLLTTKEVWDAVRETYSDAESASQIFIIRTRLWKMKLGERLVTITTWR